MKIYLNMAEGSNFDDVVTIKGGFFILDEDVPYFHYYRY